MAFWNRKEKRSVESRADSYTLEDLLLQAGIGSDTITVEQAMTIPAYSSSLHLISNTIASLPIKLYKKSGEKVETIDDDKRVALLNGDTGDTLDGFQFKKAMVVDYFNYGGGYAYLNKQRNKMKSIHYVPNMQVSVVANPDPIFKKNTFLVYANEYKDYEFVKLLRNTANGGTGFGFVAENNKMLSVVYNTLLFEEMLVKTGGNKKGFLKSQGRLSQDAITQLKQAWNNLYANNSENVVILNNGLEFLEANNSSVEMQLNQNKVSHNMEIFQMFNIPTELLQGKATGGNEMMYDSFIKLAILPHLEAFETAINSVMLLDSEKGNYCFEFDTTELMKADIQKRFIAYDLAIKNGILQIDEIRRIENYEPLGLDFIKLGLADVLFNPKTKEIYTPNTNSMVKMGDEGVVQENDPNAKTSSANGENPKADTSDNKEVKKDESGNTQQ
jgi:HK97 family phage portal protein